MWKVALFLVVLAAAGHFAVQYIRTNPLHPVIEAGDVVVETTDFLVRLSREGPVEGVYLVVSAKSIDWSQDPANVELSVIDFAEAKDFLRAYPDFHRYGSMPGLRLDNLSAPLAVIGANRLAYGKLRDLIDAHDGRVRQQGERLCITISGESLRVSAARSLNEDTDHTQTLQARDPDMRRVFANQVSVDDCVKVLAVSR